MKYILPNKKRSYNIILYSQEFQITNALVHAGRADDSTQARHSRRRMSDYCDIGPVPFSATRPVFRYPEIDYRLLRILPPIGSGHPRANGAQYNSRRVKAQCYDGFQKLVTMLCPSCANAIPDNMSFCPHCGQPGLFPNVRAAQAESAQLNAKYLSAQAKAVTRGAVAQLAEFEFAVAASLPSRNVGELELRVLATDSAMVSTFERMQSAEASMKAADSWSPPRQVAGASLFPSYQEDIRFGAIALGPNPMGVENYGAFTLVLRESMIASRTTAFVSNSARIVRNAGVQAAAKLSDPGSRAVWSDRAKLAVVKCEAAVTASTTPADFVGILLSQGATSADDEFIELHIYRPMTIRTVERVLAHVPYPTGGALKRRKPSHAIINMVRIDLKRAGLSLEEF